MPSMLGLSKRFSGKRPDLGVAGRAKSSVQELLTRPVSILAPNADGTSNAVTTSKYTLVSFVPVTLYNLLHPFQRFANFYFLCVGALQLWPESKPRHRTPHTSSPALARACRRRPLVARPA